jgi:tRNA A-37 threonylcarbamoyl transferase component Bud32
MALLGGVAVVLAGVGGGLWLRRNGDDTAIEGQEATDTVSDVTVPDSPDEDDDTLPPAVSDALEEGARLHNIARGYDDDDYERALDTFDDARDVYDTALEHARDHDTVDSSEIEAQRAAVVEDRRATRREQLTDRLSTLEDRLPNVPDAHDTRRLERVRESFNEIETELDDVAEVATADGFDDLAAEVDRLRDERASRLERVETRLAGGPPASIPRAPDLSVDYDSLVDEEPIGSGGNADVTRAILPTEDGDITLAIKKPRMSGTLHTERVERLLAEAETWDKLDDHDHIVGVVDYGSDPLPWIAMEYMDGDDLTVQAEEMNLDQKLWTATAVTSGVHHAHRRGVSHLDLKPANILFREVEGAWDVPKVADWGLSKHLLEHSKSVEGMTPHYAAPEQFDKEHGPSDHLTDVYQLGTVFYELFTGRPPFEGRPATVMRAVLDDEPTPPSEVADVPPELDEVLLTALAKDRDERYEDVLYLRDALQELFDDYRR